MREIRLVPLFRLSAVAERAAQTAREIPPPGRDLLALRLRARVFLKQREDVSRAGGARRVRSGVGHLPAVTAVKVHAAAHRAERLRLAQGEEDEQGVLRVHDGEIGQAVSERLRRAAQNGRGKRLVPEHIPRVLPARPRKKPVEKVPAHLFLCERGVVGEEIGTSAREERPAVDGDVEAAVSQAREALKGKVPDEALRFYAVKLVENDNAVCERFPEAKDRIAGVIRELEEKKDDDADSIVADGRYNRITDVAQSVVKKAPRDERGTFSDRVDRIVTHRIWGIPIFIGVIAVVFFGIIGFAWGDFEVVGIGTWCTDWVNDVFIGEWIDPAVREWCESDGTFSAVDALLCSGIIGGVGAVIGFLPQMLLMFLALCILEDIGYMARIAFVMDRVFRHFGLSGKTLIPLLVGTGCGVPGVMASRTIESERDRRITAMTTTFIPCGAKLPVIAMITSAVFPGNGLIAVFCYVMGIFLVLVSGIILKKLKSLSGTPAPFIMELPPYHIPSATNIVKGTLDRGWAFCKKAGTIILVSCIILWFLASYDTGLHYIGDNVGDAQSILAAFGEAVCVIFAPLGWGDNWELTVGTITGLIAKENVVGTFGTLFGIEAGENGEGLEVVLSGMLTKSAGLGFLAFNLICAPCFAAIGAMHRELGKWKDTGLAVLYQCLLAYAVALIIYGFTSYIGGWNSLVVDGTLVEQAAPIGSTIAGIVVLAIIVYLLWAKDPFRQLAGKDEYDAEKEMKA